MFLKLLRSFGPFLREVILGDQTVIQALGSNKAKAVTALIIAGLSICIIVLLGQVSTLTRKFANLSREYIALHETHTALTLNKPTSIPTAVVEKPQDVVVTENKPKSVPKPRVIAPKESNKIIKDKTETEKRFHALKKQYDLIKEREEKE